MSCNRSELRLDSILGSNKIPPPPNPPWTPGSAPPQSRNVRAALPTRSDGWSSRATSTKSIRSNANPAATSGRPREPRRRRRPNDSRASADHLHPVRPASVPITNIVFVYRTSRMSHGRCSEPCNTFVRCKIASWRELARHWLSLLQPSHDRGALLIWKPHDVSSVSATTDNDKAHPSAEADGEPAPW